MQNLAGAVDTPREVQPKLSWWQRVKHRLNDPGPYQYRLPFLAKASQAQLVQYRAIALTIWAVAVVLGLALFGVSFLTGSWFAIAFSGFCCFAIGRNRCMHFLFDWGPFLLFMLIYGWVKALARWVEMPVHWHLALEADLWLFNGIIPTVWLQENIRYATAPWWEFILMGVYASYFFMPYLAAVFIWLRSRMEFRRYITGFLTVTLVGFGIYTLLPAAPPWAAARCTAEDVASQPAHTPCMFSAEHAGEGSLLGAVDNQNDSPEPWVQRLTARGWSEIAPGNLAGGAEEFKDGARKDLREAGPTQQPVAEVQTGDGILISAYESTNLVAAIPSLHAGLTMFIAAHLLFARRWKTGLLALVYAETMAFALVFFAEHYVFDIILGWALAISVTGFLARKDHKKMRSQKAQAAPKISALTA